MADGLYVFETTSASDSRLYAGGQWVNDKQQRCSSCGFFIHSSEQSEIEIALNHLGRHGFAEYLWNSHSLPIFREDLVELWQSQCLTGFQLKPVRIVGWYGSPSKPLPQVIPRYFWLTPTSQVCLIDPAPLGGPCMTCGSLKYGFPRLGNHLLRGLVIDPQSWDGADFFGLRNYVFLFCTRRVAEITLGAGYSRHIAFVRATDYQRWEDFNTAKWRTSKAYAEYIENFLIRRAEALK